MAARWRMRWRVVSQSSELPAMKAILGLLTRAATACKPKQLLAWRSRNATTAPYSALLSPAASSERLSGPTLARSEWGEP
jgi:hypothetical protein